MAERRGEVGTMEGRVEAEGERGDKVRCRSRKDWEVSGEKAR